ncbi:MAG: very short patch repair endonuclease [Bryobacteraceae bacterium]
MTDALTPERRSENMRQIRARNTSPEMAVRRLVHGLGFRYRLHAKDLPGKPDLVFPGLRKIIDVRGCFWHQHPRCIDCHVPSSRQEYWKPKLKRNKERVKAHAKALRRAGWDVLVIWECEVRNQVELADRVRCFLGLEHQA